jgi:hypothetical protein
MENHLLVALVALALLARIVGKLLSGFVVRALVPAARPAGPLLGLVLLSSGPLSVSVGFVFALRFPGRVGDTLLVCAAASAVLGELVSTFALKNLLTQLGELTAAPAVALAETPAPPPSDDDPPSGRAPSSSRPPPHETEAAT